MNTPTLTITFLGTGTSQGIPMIACKCRVCCSQNPKDKRLRTSVLVETQNKKIVIDTGPDFRQQMLREKVDNLTAVVFTHEHMDHVAGLDDVRAFNFVSQKPIDLYATEHVQQSLKRVFKYVFDGADYPGLPKVRLHTINNDPFLIEGVNFIPIHVYHHKLPVLGFRIGDFSYITDANYIPEEEKKKISGSKVIAINALRKTSHVSHFTLSEAVDILEELMPEKGFIIHISHQLGLHDETAKELPEFIQPAYDGLQIVV